MAVPDFQSFMLPVLTAFRDGAELTRADLHQRVANAMDLGSEALAERVASRTQTKFENRVNWAITYLFHAALLDRPRHGVYRISSAGRQFLDQRPDRITIGTLRQIPAFARWKQQTRVEDKSRDTPEETLARANAPVPPHAPEIPLMAVPDFQSLMLPVLTAFRDGAELSLADLRLRVATAIDLGKEALTERVPSGVQTKFENRVHWATVYLFHADLLDRPRRGIYRISSEGRQFLDRRPDRISTGTLGQIPAFARWKQRTRVEEESVVPEEKSTETPEETLARAYDRLHQILAEELLDRVRQVDPEFLEQMIVDLMIRMGYGGGDPEFGTRTGGTGDGGIDGIIKEDNLGLDNIYIQAKRYADGHAVGEGELRNFVGAIDTADTDKGVFVTTSKFTSSAREYVKRSSKRIVMIDGKRLADLMIQYNIGVRGYQEFHIKRIDQDYFSPDA